MVTKILNKRVFLTNKLELLKTIPKDQSADKIIKDILSLKTADSLTLRAADSLTLLVILFNLFRCTLSRVSIINSRVGQVVFNVRPQYRVTAAFRLTNERQDVKVGLVTVVECMQQATENSDIVPLSDELHEWWGKFLEDANISPLDHLNIKTKV